MTKLKRERIERNIKRTVLKNLTKINPNFKTDFETLINWKNNGFSTYHLQTAIPLIVSTTFDNLETEQYFYEYLLHFKLEFPRSFQQEIKTFSYSSNEHISVTLHQLLDELLREQVNI